MDSGPAIIAFERWGLIFSKLEYDKGKSGQLLTQLCSSAGCFSRAMRVNNVVVRLPMALCTWDVVSALSAQLFSLSFVSILSVESDFSS